MRLVGCSIPKTINFSSFLLLSVYSLYTTFLLWEVENLPSVAAIDKTYNKRYNKTVIRHLNKIRKTCFEDLNRKRKGGGVGGLNSDTQTVAFQNTTLLRFMSACAGIHNSALSFFLHVCVYIQQGITQAGLCL